MDAVGICACLGRETRKALNHIFQGTVLATDFFSSSRTVMQDTFSAMTQRLDVGATDKQICLALVITSETARRENVVMSLLA
jgi:hypothetical protein